jgi:acetylornithine/succinyldiaminopimelate/putrescine aminotransferase
VRHRAAHFRAGLDRIAARSPKVAAVRGRGFIQGLQLTEPGAPVVTACLARGVLLNCTADTVLRFLPPLVIMETEIDQALAIVEEVLCS